MSSRFSAPSGMARGKRLFCRPASGPAWSRGGRRMRHWKQVHVVGSISLVMTLAAVWVLAQPSERTIKVAVVGSLLASETRIGGLLQKGAQLAVEEQAEAMQALGLRIELLVHDATAYRWEAGREGQPLREP